MAPWQKLKGKQKELDKNKDGKISGEDFKMMKAKKDASVKKIHQAEAKTNIKQNIKAILGVIARKRN